MSNVNTSKTTVNSCLHNFPTITGKAKKNEKSSSKSKKDKEKHKEKSKRSKCLNTPNHINNYQLWKNCIKS